MDLWSYVGDHLHNSLAMQTEGLWEPEQDSLQEEETQNHPSKEKKQTKKVRPWLH